MVQPEVSFSSKFIRVIRSNPYDFEKANLNVVKQPSKCLKKQLTN